MVYEVPSCVLNSFLATKNINYLKMQGVNSIKKRKFCNGVLLSYKNIHEVKANKCISGSVDVPGLTHSV